MDIDLKDLRLRREEEPAGSTRGKARAGVLVPWLLLLGALAYIAYSETMRVQAAPSAAPSSEATGEARGGALAPVRVATQQPGGFSATGWIKLPNYHPVFVSPLIEGRLEQVDVIEGDTVSKGQVVARLYEGDLALVLAAAQGTLAVAEANLANLQAGFRAQEIQQARAEVVRLEALAERAALDLERAEQLAPSGAIAREDLDAARAAGAAAAAAVHQAREVLSLKEEGYRPEEIELARTQVAKARAERDLAQARLDHCQIVSPMDGVVLERLAFPGQWVTPGRGAVLSLYDPDDMEARIDVNQEQASLVFIGQNLELLTRAEPGRAHPARVVLIEPKADLIKNIVRVKAKFLAPRAGFLLPDMVVQARFHPRETEMDPE